MSMVYIYMQMEIDVSLKIIIYMCDFNNFF